MEKVDAGMILRPALCVRDGAKKKLCESLLTHSFRLTTSRPSRAPMPRPAASPPTAARDARAGRGLHSLMHRATVANRRPFAPPVAALSEVALLFAGSAAPFLAIQALADSPAGKRLADSVASRKSELDAAAAAAASARVAAARASPLYGPHRPRVPAPAPHLEAVLLPGNYGFDPLGLCADKGTGVVDRSRLDSLYEFELLHARWAMLGALGALVPEALTLAGLATFPEDRWFAVGASKLRGEDLNYFGVPGLRIAGCQGVAIIAFAQLLLMSGPELARAAGKDGLEPVGIYLDGQDQNYPGGVLFDPLRLASRDPDAAVRLRVAEIKHGRLAMVACVGFAAAAANGSDGPLRDLIKLF